MISGISMSLSFNKHNQIILNDIGKLTKNGLNNVVPEELFDDLEIVDDDLKDGKKVNSEIKERIELLISKANCDV